jgi:hypothetical protein
VWSYFLWQTVTFAAANILFTIASSLPGSWEQLRRVCVPSGRRPPKLQALKPWQLSSDRPQPFAARLFTPPSVAGATTATVSDKRGA